MRPYKDFKNDIIELIEYAISPDRKHGFFLKDFVGNTFCWRVADTTSECGSVACIAGYTPELWPEIFSWMKNGTPQVIRTGDAGNSICKHFMGIDTNMSKVESIKNWYIQRIFSSNSNNILHDGGSDDITVAKFRLEAVRKCRSYKQLTEYIKCYGQWF